jgi:hypothetical protein
MSFLRHPIYTALAVGASVWLSMANARGLSMLYSANPVHWAMFNAAGSGSRGYHGTGHFSHK